MLGYDLSMEWHRLVPTYPSDKATAIVTAFVTEYGRHYAGGFWNEGACILDEGHPMIDIVLDRNAKLPDFYHTIPAPLAGERFADVLVGCAPRDVQFLPVNVPGYDWQYMMMNVLEWNGIPGANKIFTDTTLVDESGGFFINPILFCLEEPLHSDAAILMVGEMKSILINSDVKSALLGSELSGFEVGEVYVRREGR